MVEIYKKVVKVGNSMALLIPKQIVEVMSLKEGDLLKVELTFHSREPEVLE